MPAKDPPLILQTAPFLIRGTSTPRVMIDVIIGIAPVVAASIWFFGISALLVLAVCIAGAMITEAIFAGEKKNLADGSAALTGLLVGLTLPPSMPLWMAFLGGGVAIGLGKTAWGGLGQNIFNPALVGRAFLQAAFPISITSWTPARGLADFFRTSSSTFAIPFMKPTVDAISTATPMKGSGKNYKTASWLALLIGNVSGSLGETSALLALVGAIYMTIRRTFEWRIPVSIFVSVAALSGGLHLLNNAYPTPSFMLLSGGLVFGAIFMATDPVTSPMTAKGAWIFGVGIGILVVLIRTFGALDEGVMYAILFMNALCPHIDRYTQPKPFGRRKSS
jgi:Na+-translocating ferredoxin:NAD+ oxidoreductase subunit D